MLTFLTFVHCEKLLLCLLRCGVYFECLKESCVYFICHVQCKNQRIMKIKKFFQIKETSPLVVITLFKLYLPQTYWHQLQGDKICWK
jgi:hypothetical protein